MRYVFRFGFALALGLALMAGCSDENGGEDGSGGTAGTGGTAGEGGGGTGGMPECQSPEDCDDGDDCTLDTCIDGVCSHVPAEDGVSCANDSGRCIASSCWLTSCEGIENGEACFGCGLGAGGGCDFGSCLDGVCESGTTCEVDADCTDYNDCTSDTCHDVGICEFAPLRDGALCAGGSCQGGECSIQSSVLPCTEQGIRNAIAAGRGPYTFDCDDPTTIVTEAEIAIDNDVILDGEGKLTVDGNQDHRVFSVPEDVTAQLQGFAVSGGNARLGGSGIFNLGKLTLVSSTVSGNSGSFGGGIRNLGTLTLVSTTVSGNAASAGGGGIQNGGSVGSVSRLTLINSTVSGNAAVGIHNTMDATTTLLNSTVSGNTGSPSGIFNGGAMTLTNTLVDDDCLGPIASGGHNIESPANTCGFDTNKGDQFDVTAEQLNLGPLQDNGGPAMTHALLPGSVAIDEIPEADCVDADGQPLTTDQRREPRPETGGTMCDVGAFEVQP